MQHKKHTRTRRGEVFTGLLIILLAFSYVASLLLDFKFVSLYATLQEDLTYLSEHIQNQKISSYSWMVTSLITFLAIPLYINIFWKHMKLLPILNSICILGASAGFMLMARTGLDLQQEAVLVLGEGLEITHDQLKDSLLEQYQLEQFYRHVGSSCVGLFAIGLGVTRFKLVRFPVLASVLLLLSGPVLIFFNWTEPDHLARTGAMAGVIIGMVVFCVRLINKGLNPVPR